MLLQFHTVGEDLAHEQCEEALDKDVERGEVESRGFKFCHVDDSDKAHANDESTQSIHAEKIDVLLGEYLVAVDVQNEPDESDKAYHNGKQCQKCNHQQEYQLARGERSEVNGDG